MAYKDIAVGNVYGTWYLRLYLTENSTNIPNNTSSVHRKLTLRCASAGSSVSFDRREAWIGGNRKTIAYSHASSEHTLIEDDVTVAHGSDGKGSYTCSFGISTSYVLNGSSSLTLTLSTIPRAAKITSSSDFNDEQNPTIGISNPGKFNMEAWLEPNPTGDHLAIRTISNTATSYTWELTDEERKQLREACKGNSCIMRIGLYSNNKSFTNYVDKKFSIINGNPVFTEASFITTNHLDLADEQTIIKGYSNITVTLGKAISQKESTITSYKVICGNSVSQGNDLIYKLSNVDDSIIRCFAIDSRGNTTEKIINVPKYINYTPITLDVLNYERSDGGIGTGVEITFSGNLWMGNFGKVENTISAQYFFKKRNSSSDLIQGITTINPNVAAKYQKTALIKGDNSDTGFDNGSDYTLKVKVQDKLSSNEKEVILTKGMPHLDFCQYGIAIGGIYDETLLVDDKHPIAQIYSSKEGKMIPVEWLIYDNGK